ncbi:MAG: hypothetical protein HYT87_13425 [Nitrospirae bacterium]|nr:hypothetical protein [Nitrospirota bacterium]
MRHGIFWGALLAATPFIASCPADTGNLDGEQSVASKLDAMPDADLSTSEKAKAALAALGDQGGFQTLLDPGDASFGQNEMMEMALLGMQFTDQLTDDESPAAKDLDAEAESTPAEDCADLQADLAKYGLTCPIVECSASGNTFKNLVKGDCEGRDRSGNGFKVQGESIAEGTFDEAGGNVDVKVTYRSFRIAFDRTLPFGGPSTASTNPSPKSIKLTNTITADGEFKWQVRGRIEKSLDFSGEVEGRLSVGLGLAYEMDGKSGGGNVMLKISMGQKVASKQEQFTFNAHYSQECEGKATDGSPSTGSVLNQIAGSIGREGPAMTLNTTGRLGDYGMETCVEGPSHELQKIVEEAYGVDSSRKSTATAHRFPRLLQARRSHNETGDGDSSLNGKFSFKAESVAANPESCKREPVSGTMILTTPTQTVEVAFDGGAKCDGTAGLKVNGKEAGKVETGDFLLVGSARDSEG